MRQTYRARAATVLTVALLSAWAVGWFHTMSRGGGMAWHFFLTGDTALAQLHNQVQGGLHVYAAMPYLQIGPLALVGSFALQHLTPDGGLVAVELLGAAAGVAIVLLVRSIARTARPIEEVDRLLAPAVLLFTPVWMYVAVRATHLDDVLALLFGVLALRLALDGRALWAGAAVGLAVDAKPWALPFACLLLLLPTVRERVVGAVSGVAFIAAGWLPFVLADSRTASSLDHFTIKNQATSALRLLGVTSARTPPWDRPAQAALGIALALLAIRRGRWAAVILLVVLSRVVLDPGVNRYYAAGVAVGALVWDLAGSRSRFPFWTAATFVGLFASRYVALPNVTRGSLTLGFFLLAMLLLAVRPARGSGHVAGTVAVSASDDVGVPLDRPVEHAGASRRGGPCEEGGG